MATASQFDMKKVTTPLLLHMLGKELRFPRLFLLLRKLTLNRFKKSIDTRFPRELIDLAALPAWVYLNLKNKIGQRKAFEVMRVALLAGGTAAQNLQFDTVHKERNFRNFADLEVENNRSGLVRWNKMEVVERTDRRFELKITRCMFHEFALSLGIPEMTPIVCQIDNAMFNSYLPDEMVFDRGGVGRRIADGNHECNFMWELRWGAQYSCYSGDPMKLKLWLFAPVLLAGCAANMHAAHHQGGEPMHISATDMKAMCDMHNEMMSGKTPEQRQAMMEKHMKSMSPEMREHMQMMQQQCK